MKETMKTISTKQVSFIRSFHLIRQIDYSLLIAVFFLCLIGLLAIHSTTHSQSLDQNTLSLARRQFIYIVIGLLISMILSIIDYHEIEKIGLVLYLFSIILLVYVIFFGRMTGGSRRWIVLAGFDFQPAEVAKIALICFLADFLTKQREKLSYALYYFLPLFFSAILILLVFQQPDLGTSMVFFAISIIMIFIAGFRWKHIFIMGIFAVSSFPILWFSLKEYQKNRIILFLNPNLDPLGAGYNVIQSKVAIGSGGLFGQGLFSGIQSQLKFLPAQHTDFVFSVIGEEMGFIGAAVLLLLSGFILWKGIKVAMDSPDIFGTFLATGVVSFLFFHILINIGMTMGLMPATGLPLPFVSYGGTFMVSNFIGIGILQSIHLRSLLT